MLLSGLLDLGQLLKDTDVVFETDRLVPALFIFFLPPPAVLQNPVSYVLLILIPFHFSSSFLSLPPPLLQVAACRPVPRPLAARRG